MPQGSGDSPSLCSASLLHSSFCSQYNPAVTFAGHTPNTVPNFVQTPGTESFRAMYCAVGSERSVLGFLSFSEGPTSPGSFLSNLRSPKLNSLWYLRGRCQLSLCRWGKPKARHHMRDSGHFPRSRDATAAQTPGQVRYLRCCVASCSWLAHLLVFLPIFAQPDLE